jgi:butyryl-CoA dehydrogenase
MDFELNDEQRLIRETARAFTDNEIIDRARENDRNEHFDLELVAKIADQGYLGAIVPREYGGAGLDYLTYGLVVEEVGRGDSAMRTVISVQTSLVCSAILRWGTEEQKQHYLPKLCTGEWLGCFGLTEPDTGSDAANQRTRARKSNGGWVINGAKMWISMGNHARVALIFVQTDPDKAHRGLACFLVDTDQPGFQPQPIHHKMGLRGSDTAAISLDDVEVSDEQMLGEVGDGFKVAMSSLDSGRYSVAAGCVGICQGCVEASVDYAKEREQFGRPIASFQLVQGMLADMYAELESLRSFTYHVGAEVTALPHGAAHKHVAKRAAAVVLQAGRTFTSVTDKALQVHGGAGYIWETEINRLYRAAKLWEIGAGTTEIRQIIIAQELLTR